MICRRIREEHVHSQMNSTSKTSAPSVIIIEKLEIYASKSPWGN